MTWSPASTSSWIVQSKRASPSSRVSGAVVGGGQRAARRSGARPARRAAGTPSSWWSASIVTPEVAGPAQHRPGLASVVATENDTSGGSRLTEVNELAARPTRAPSTSAATATTPLGKTPNTSRSRCGSRSWLVREGRRGHARAPVVRASSGVRRAGRERRQPVVVGLGTVVLVVEDEERAARGRRRRARPAAGAGAAPAASAWCGAGAEHQRDGHPAQPDAAGEPVEEQLEQAGVGGLVRRAGDHDQVGRADLVDEGRDRRVLPVQQRRAEVARSTTRSGSASVSRAGERGRRRRGCASPACGLPTTTAVRGPVTTRPRAANGTACDVCRGGAGCSQRPRSARIGSTPSPNQ